MTFRSRTIVLPYVICIVLTILLMSAEHLNSDADNHVLQRLENLTYDLRIKQWKSQRKNHIPPILIVDIDERSLREVGQFPWRREKVAELFEKIDQSGAAVIGADILFSEPQHNDALQILAAVQDKKPSSDTVKLLQELAIERDGDALFSRQLKNMRSDSVFGIVFQHDQVSQGTIPDSHLIFPQTEINQLPLFPYNSFTGVLPVLSSTIDSAGFFNITQDGDGVIRSAELISRYNNMIYSSLSLEVTRLFLLSDNTTLIIKGAQDGKRITAIQLDAEHVIPVSRDGSMMIPYIGPAGSFTYISATDILHGRHHPDLFKDAIVLLGTSALGLVDLRTTPFQSAYPGVEVHANIIAAILDNRFLTKPDWNDAANLLLLLVLGLGLTWFLPTRSPLTVFVTWTGSVSLITGLNYYCWQHLGLVLSLATPLLLVSSITIMASFYGYFFESRARGKITDMFAQYVPPAHVAELSKNPEAFSFEGESRTMTVLFCDIRHFTSISEQMNASELKQFLNAFFTPMTATIFEHTGTIDKYVGDMIMAFWGAPLPDDRHAEHAVLAALAMQKNAEQLRHEFRNKAWPEPYIGIGLNSGVMNVGDMGSSFRRAYTVIGDEVNLASRLEGLTKVYGVGILVSEKTKNACPSLAFRVIDRVRVKGKQQAVLLYEPLTTLAAFSSAQQQDLLEHEHAFTHYQNGGWSEAQSAYTALAARSPHPYYDLMLIRINALQQSASEQWDGVFEHLQK